MSRILFERLSTILVGAIAGGALAWFLERIGFSPLGIYLLLVCFIATWLYVEFYTGVVFDPFGRIRVTLTTFSKVLLVLLLTAISFGVEAAFDVNPQDYAYLPVVPLIVASTALFGFGAGLFAVILSSIIAAYFFIPPIYSLAIYEWEDAIGLAIFAILGSLVALGIHELFFPVSNMQRRKP